MQRILFDEFTVRTIRSVSTPTQIRWISRGTMTILKVEIIIPKSDLKIHAYRKINFVETLKENRKTNVRQVYMRYWYPKPQPLEIAFREKITN